MPHPPARLEDWTPQRQPKPWPMFLFWIGAIAGILLMVFLIYVLLLYNLPLGNGG